VATPAPLGTLEVDVRPPAVVEVEGRPAGSAPLQGLPIDPGPHVLTLAHPDYWPLRRRIGVEAGKTSRLEVDLAWEGVPRSRSREAPYSVPLDGSPSDPYFERGLKQMAEGNYQEAVLTLEPVARRLQGTKTKEQARAEFYLGVAYLEMNRQALAKERFSAALEHDPSFKPTSSAFSSKVMGFFGAVREGARKKP
jgi:tetratricopeptide (TPR) repeat protein